MDRKLKSALKQSFTPPQTQQRDKFISVISYPKATFKEVLLSQIGFIRKRIWIAFFVCVSFAFLYTNYTDIPISIITGLSALLPLFSLCTITEIYKSTAYNMDEMELACKYNLSKITLMRLGILGAVSFVILLLYVVFAKKSEFGAFRNLIYLGAPYLLSSYLSLVTISIFKNKETIYVCSAISGGVSILVLMANSRYTFIYYTNFKGYWIISFIVLVGLMTCSLIRFKNSQEELQWNLL